MSNFLKYWWRPLTRLLSFDRNDREFIKQQGPLFVLAYDWGLVKYDETDNIIGPWWVL